MCFFQQVLALQTLLKKNLSFSNIDFQLAQLLAEKGANQSGKVFLV